MSNTLAPSIVTNRDPKGTKFMSVVGAAYDKNRLTEDEAQRVNEAKGLSDLIDRFIAENRHEVPPLLMPVTKVSVTGSERFVANKAALKAANVGWTGSNFDQYFLNHSEESVGDASLAIHRLEKASLDAPIRKELGTEREETTLTHFFALLREQSKGQAGPLLTNGYANIAYIKGNNGNLWAVSASWYSAYRYWRVRANSVEDPDAWLAGYQVLSCDC